MTFGVRRTVARTVRPGPGGGGVRHFVNRISVAEEEGFCLEVDE